MRRHHPLYAMRKQFLQKALPTQGVYCAVGIKDGNLRHEFVDTLDQLDKTFETLINHSLNVYVALNTFNTDRRLADNAVFCRSFFVDLDVGDSGHKYDSKDAARSALAKFLLTSELPPPVMVDSGTGLHAYWLFSEDVPSDE